MINYLIILIIVAVFLVIFYVISRNLLSSSKIDKAIKFLNKKEYDEALKLLKDLIQKNDRNVLAHYYLGEVYFLKENMEYALPEFRKVIQLNNYSGDLSEARVRERLAEIFLHFNQLEEAQKELLLILKLEPENYNYYYRVGEIFYQRNFKENAAGYFQKAYELNPSHIDTLFRLGEIYYDSRRPSDALIYMKNCLKGDPGYHKAHYYIGMIYLDSKNYLQAIQEFEISQGDSEYRLRSFLQKGRAYLDSSNPDKAIVELQRGESHIKEENSVSTALRYLLADVYERIRDIPSALTQWERISMVNPKYRDVPQKLEEYQDLRLNDVLKDFLTASDSKFESICEKIANKLNYEVLDKNITRGVVGTLITSEPESQWRGVKRAKQLFKIFRLNDKVGDKIIREMLEEMKHVGAVRAICISASDFTRQALEYAETRPIELYDRIKLTSVLSK